MKDYDKDSLYVKRNEKCAFVLDKPGEIKKKKKKGESDGPEIMVRDLVRFYKVDKSTMEAKLVLTIGMPNASYDVKTGCGKKQQEKVKFIELPRIPDHIDNSVEYEEENAYIVTDKKEDEKKGCGKRKK
jgi:hypothetical protein